MAYVKIKTIKSTPGKALDYIENPDKTEQQLLVSGYNVDPLTASMEFQMTAALAREVKGDYTRNGGADNLAYHLVQSFAPWDKITPEAAHELGKRWADEVLKGKYEYVIATHVDKGQIHNHIIFNATSFLDFKKFENYKVLGELRRTSDALCEEKGLYVMGRSWQSRNKAAIDAAIERSGGDYAAFVQKLNDLGVEVKEGARLSFRMTHAGQEHFTRGDRIGQAYSREGIRQRLEVIGKQTPEERRFLDYTRQLERQPRWKQRAETQALVEALHTIRTERIGCDEDFAARISELEARARQVDGAVREAEAKARQYEQAAKYLLAVRDGSALKQEEAAQPPEKRAWFAARYGEELKTYDYALDQLSRMKVDPKVDPEKVLGLVREKLERAGQLREGLEGVQKRIEALRAAWGQVEDIRGQTRPQERPHGGREGQTR